MAAGRGRARRAGGQARAHGTQLALPLDLHDAPELEELSVWDRLLADYGSIGVTLHEHPLELMRPTLPDGCFSSADLARARDGTPVRWPGWWWPASARPPPRASRSCCSRTSSAPST